MAERSDLEMTWWLPVSDGVAHAAPVESEALAVELAQRRFGKSEKANTWMVLPITVVLPVGVLAPWAASSTPVSTPSSTVGGGAA